MHIGLPHATKSVFNLDLSDDLITMGLDLLQKLPLRWDDLLEGAFEVRLRRAGIASAWHNNNWSNNSRLTDKKLAHTEPQRIITAHHEP